MKNNIKKILTRINWRIVFIIAFLIAFESFFYMISKLTFINATVLSNNLTNKLPFIPSFVYFYISWYAMLFIIPYIIYQKNKELLYEYIAIFTSCVLVSSIIFFCFPTTMIRGDFNVTGITTFILKFIYFTDTPVLNCLPSMHCAICFVFMYFSFKLDLKWYYKLSINLLSVLVILSTIFIRQHVIWDVLAALIMVLVIILLANLTNLSKYIEKTMKRIKFTKDI